MNTNTVKLAFYKSIPVFAGYVVLGSVIGSLPLLSILAGTLIYMALVQLVF